MVESWSRRLVKSLMIATHKQWLFRNAHVHFQKLEGLTALQHEEIYKLVDELMETDPEELLDRHRYLLEVDFEELGGAPTSHRQTWVNSMQSAMAAANHVRTRGVILESPEGARRRSRFRPRPLTEGSLVYRRNRRLRG